MTEAAAAFDPRLAPLLEEIRRTSRFGFVPGVLLALLGAGALFVLFLAVRDEAGVGAVLCTGSVALGFLVPGLRIAVKGLRGPLATAEGRLLTTEQAKLAAWDIEQVSINRGPVHPRLLLIDARGESHSVRIPQGHEASVRACVATRAPQRVRQR